MKKIISIILLLGILFGITSSISMIVSAEKDESVIQNFINDSIKLINQVPNSSMILNNGEESEANSDFETCRLIIKADKKPDKLNSIGIASGFEDYHVVQFKSESDTEAAYEYYSKQEEIKSVCLDELIAIYEDETESDYIEDVSTVPKRLNSWGADAIGLYDLKDYLTENNVQMNEVVVAVVDTGVDLEHEFLQGRLIETGFNASALGAEKSETDNYGHGTKVSSVIVDSTPEKIKIAAYKISDDGSITKTEAVLGILQAVNDAVDIINTSFSIVDHEGIVSDTVKYAYDNGITVVASAGNYADYIDVANAYPAQSVYSITATSIGEHCMPSSFTSYGKCVDIAAPGEKIPVAYLNNSYLESSGTSFAAPYVAAVCAIIKSLNPNYTVDDIKDNIKENATPFDEIITVHDNIDELFGVGIIDALDALDYIRQADIEVNIKPGDYYEPISIELASEGSEKIYYTLDQTTPTKDNGILYTEPIEIAADCFVVRAIAYSEGKFRSKVFSGYYKSWQKEPENNFTIDETGKILSYVGTSSSLLIPETVNGITVTDIANGVFDDSQVFSVMLPKTITKLTGGFFENKNVAYVYGESVVEIGGSVFQRSNISYVYFPNAEKVGRYAFRTTFNLIGVNFPKLKIAERYSFSNSGIKYAYLPKLETAGEGFFYYSFALIKLYAPKLKNIGDTTPYYIGSKWFSDSLVFTPLDLPLVEKVYKNDLISKDERYIRRIEFSNLKELGGLPTSATSSANYIMVLPATIEAITASKELVDKGTYTIYGTSGTLVEKWANENGFEFIEITPETAVITDLPEYYKSYMGELEADVVGFNRQYQWYANTVNSNEGGTPIEGATNKAFNPSDFPAPYYYCVVTSTDKGFDPVVIKTSACENRAAVADYSKVNEALAKVPEDLSIYTAESRLNLENAINAVDKNLDISHQAQVDAMAKDVEEAIAALELKPVDVFMVEAVIQMTCGESRKLTVVCDEKVTFESSDTSVATVNENGVVTAVGKGTATITAASSNETDTCIIEVKFTFCQLIVYWFNIIVSFIVNCILSVG